MTDEQIRTALCRVRMPAEMKRRVALRAAREVPPSRRAIRRPLAAALAAACLAFLLSVPVLAAAVDPVYDLLYRVSPAAAQFFKPVRVSAEDNGIEMEVVSVSLRGDTAEICIALRDLTGGRVDATTDLYDSYSLRSPFDASAHCSALGYEEETGTALFLVSVTRADGRDISGGKATFSLTQFLSQNAVYEGVEISPDLTRVSEAAKTQRVSWTGGGGLDFDAGSELVTALVPGEPGADLPVEGIGLTGLALVGGELHVQIAVEEPLRCGNYGFVYLETSGGELLDSDRNFTFTQETASGRVYHTEFVFSVTAEELAGCRLLGDFWTSGLSVRGDWSVTFPVEQTGVSG